MSQQGKKRRQRREMRMKQAEAARTEAVAVAARAPITMLEAETLRGQFKDGWPKVASFFDAVTKEVRRQFGGPGPQLGRKAGASTITVKQLRKMLKKKRAA